MKVGNKKGVSENLRALGVAFFEKGDYTTAKDFYEKALKISNDTGDEQMQSRCIMNIGNIYLVQGNYPVALEYHNKSLVINEQRKDTFLISLSLSNIGHIYRNIGQNKKALTFSKRALDIQKKIGNKQRIVETLINLGLIYIELKDYKEAQKIFNTAINISKEFKSKFLISMALNNLGYVYLKAKDYNKAIEYYEKARNINLSIDGKRSLTTSYYGLAKAYFNQKKYEEALQYALKSQQLSKNLNIPDSEKGIQELLSTIYENTGQYKKALESHQQFKILSDSLFNKGNIEKITQLEYEYKYKQALDSASIKELQLTKTVTATNLNLEKSQRNYLWAVIGALLLSILFGAFIFYQKLKDAKTKTQNAVMEQKLLRSQMTPHFIFNSLSVLQGMILNKEEEKSVSYLSKFSKLLRIVLENSRDKIVPLKQELDAIDNYMILQNLDTYPPYNYSLVVDENIDINSFQIPPMLIQPFIENIIEHAFTPDKKNREIMIHLKFTDKKLICSIADNGIGIDAISKNKNTNKNSLATKITNERLQLLSKEFKVKGDITIEDRNKYDEQGTLVTLTIPYKLNSIV